MPIAEYHMYHGVALSLIVSEGKFTGLAKLPEYGAGAYAINHDKGVYIKHSTIEMSPWNFTFKPEHQENIRSLFNRYQERAFIVLVCGQEGVCLLEYGQYASIIDENFRDQRWLAIEKPRGGGFRVRGAGGSFRHVIRLNWFPEKIFE